MQKVVVEDLKMVTLKNLPDVTSMNGSVDVMAIRSMLRPILIIKENRDNPGPGLEMAIDYYAPAAAARLGMAVDRTQYIVKSETDHDDTYIIVDLPKLIVDPWGRSHAGAGDTHWREMPIAYYESIMKVTGNSTSRQIGRIGVFHGPDGVLRRRLIEAYNGSSYFSKGERIKGRLVRTEEA